MGMKLSSLVLATFISICSQSVSSTEYTFDPAMLGGDNVDVSLFSQGLQPPGTYPVDIILNGSHVDSREVVFNIVKRTDGSSSLEPCLSAELLDSYGVKTQEWPKLAESSCADISLIPEASSELQLNDQSLILNIPQIALRPKVRGIAPQSLWNDGIPAGLLNYRASTSKSSFKSGRSSENQWIQLSPGLNWGAWRVRNQSSWQKQNGDSGEWDSAYTYAERGFYNSKSRLTLGERSTPGDVFDSVPFRGVMYGSDENMVPFNQRSYAPVVRGIARTQARIEVKQGGYTIYNDTVAAGPFALSDISPVSSGGDLDVTISEADGSVQHLVVPYNMPAIALREGYFKYSAMIGEYRTNASYGKDENTGQLTLMYGLPWDLTVYGGMQYSEHYRSAAVGAGLSMGKFGAVSVDATNATSQSANGNKETGNVWRLRYSRDFAETGTSFAFGSYQYASEGYRTIGDTLDNFYRNSDAGSYNKNNRSKTTLTLSQSVGDYGYLSLNGNRETYRGISGHNDTYGISYGTSINGISVSMNLSKSKVTSSSGIRSDENQAGLWLSIPLNFGVGNSVNATYQVISPSDGPVSQTAGLNGRAFDRQLSWDVRQRVQEGKSSDTSSLQLGWDGAYGTANGNYSYSPDYQQTSASVAGGIVFHDEGITLAQPLGDTNVLVAAPGASNVPVGYWPGVQTDFRGYTSYGGLTPYQKNNVSLDPTYLSSDVEVSQTDISAVPTQGAIIRASFDTKAGARALMTLKRPQGQAVPFGAVVKLSDNGKNESIVGEGGQVYLSGLSDREELEVHWGQNNSCKAEWITPEHKEPLSIVETLCR
jgi:outer membrane usher protein